MTWSSVWANIKLLLFKKILWRIFPPPKHMDQNSKGCITQYYIRSHGKKFGGLECDNLHLTSEAALDKIKKQLEAEKRNYSI